MRELNYIDETIERNENPALRIGSVGRSALSTVYLMDCIEGMKQFPDKIFDLAVVDPPYGIGADVNQNKLGNKKGFTKNAGTYKKYHETNWDNEAPSKFYFDELIRVSKNQIVWGGNYFFDLHLTGVIVWNKKGSGNFKEGELAKTSINTFKVFDYSRADAYINDCDVKIHPTQKPVKLYEWIFRNYAEEGNLILDTHLGSQSSRIAANKAGLDFVGFEIDREYFDNGNTRFKNFVSQGVLF